MKRANPQQYSHLPHPSTPRPQNGAAQPRVEGVGPVARAQKGFKRTPPAPKVNPRVTAPVDPQPLASSGPASTNFTQRRHIICSTRKWRPGQQGHGASAGRPGPAASDAPAPESADVLRDRAADEPPLAPVQSRRPLVEAQELKMLIPDGVDEHLCSARAQHAHEEPGAPVLPDPEPQIEFATEAILAEPAEDTAQPEADAPVAAIPEPRRASTAGWWSLRNRPPFIRLASILLAGSFALAAAVVVSSNALASARIAPVPRVLSTKHMAAREQITRDRAELVRRLVLAYIAQHGRAPAKLDDLVPAFVPGVPQPINGATTWEYEPSPGGGKGFVLAYRTSMGGRWMVQGGTSIAGEQQWTMAE